MTIDEKETRVLEYLEGDLAPEDEQALLADAGRDPELAAILADYRRQETLLHGFHDAQAAGADRVRRPDLSSLPAAKVVRAGTATRWMAAAAAVAVLAAGSAVLMRPTAEGTVGTVAYATGTVRAFDDGRTIALVGETPVDAAFDRIKIPSGGSLEIAMAGGGAVELNENSTVRFAKGGDAPELELDRGEVLVHGATTAVKTPWFAAESTENASFSVSRGLRGAEVAVAKGSVDLRRDGTLRRLNAGETWSSTGVRAVPVAQRVAWSRHANDLLPKAKQPTAEPAVAAVDVAEPIEVASAEVATTEKPATAMRSASAATTSSVASTTKYLPANTVAFVEVPNVRELLGGHDLSDALLGERLRSIILGGIDRVRVEETDRARMRADALEFFDDANLNLLLSSLGGSASAGVAGKGPILIAQITDNAAEVETLVNETIPATVDDMDDLRLWVSNGMFVAGFDQEAFDAATNAIRSGTPTGFASSPFAAEVRSSVGPGSRFVAASDVQAILNQSGNSDSDARAFQRIGLSNLRSIVASPSFADDTENRALRLRFDGPRQGAMAWLDEPGPMSGFEFFSPDTHVLTAARIKSPFEMLQELVAWNVEDRGTNIEDLETDEGYLSLNSFAASLGNEVVVGLDNPVLPVPNVKIVFELTDPEGFHDGMLEFVERVHLGDQGDIAAETSTYRNHLIVDLKIPGKAVGLSYAVVDDYAVFGPGRPFLQAAIDTFVDGRSIDREPAFVEALPAKSGSNVSWLLFAARNDSMRDAAPFLAQALSNQGVPIDLDAVASAVPGRSVVLYAIADDDRIDYYLEGIKGEFQMTGMLPAVTEWLVENGG